MIHVFRYFKRKFSLKSVSYCVLIWLSLRRDLKNKFISNGELINMHIMMLHLEHRKMLMLFYAPATRRMVRKGVGV